MNEFADLESNEFVSMINSYKSVSSNTAMFTYDSSVELPNAVDWRTKGYVTRVKNEGRHCFSSWAFSVTGSIEGQHFRKTGTLISLSEQNLIDCSKDNAGCIGGYEDRAFDFVVKSNGIDTEVSYPYTANEGVCRFNQSHVGADINGYVNITSKDDNALQQAVAYRPDHSHY